MDNAAILVTNVPTLPIIMFLPNIRKAFLKHANGHIHNTEISSTNSPNIPADIPNANHKPFTIPVNIPSEKSTATPIPRIMLRRIAVP